MTTHQASTKMSGIEILRKLREEPFNEETERRLQSHPYLKAAEDGTLTLSQRRAFAIEQRSIQLSDAISFARLAGHGDFAPSSLAGATVPAAASRPGSPPRGEGEEDDVDVDLFQFLLGGEVYAAPLLIAYAKSVGLDETAMLPADDDDDDDRPGGGSYEPSPLAQAYPSYWARLALSGRRAAGAAACAVNFPAWGAMCRRLLEALGGSSGRYDYAGGVDDEALAFVKFFATPIEDLDRMAAAVMDDEGASYEEIVESVRLLQQYEVMFWDGIFEK